MSASPSATPWPLEDPEAFRPHAVPAPVMQPAYASEQFADVIALDQSVAEAQEQQTYVLKPKLSAWILAGAAMVFAVVFAFVMWPSGDDAKRAANNSSTASESTSSAADDAAYGDDMSADVATPGGGGPEAAPFDAPPKTTAPKVAKHDPLDDVMDIDGPLPAPVHYDTTPRVNVPAPAVSPVNPSSPRRPGGGTSAASTARPAAPTRPRPSASGSGASAAANSPAPSAAATTAPATMVHVAVPNNGAWGYTDVDSRRIVLLSNAGTTNVTGALRGYVWSGTAWTQAYVLPTVPGSASASGGGAAATTGASASGGGAPMKTPPMKH